MRRIVFDQIEIAALIILRALVPLNLVVPFIQRSFRFFHEKGRKNNGDHSTKNHMKQNMEEALCGKFSTFFELT